MRLRICLVAIVTAALFFVFTFVVFLVLVFVPVFAFLFTISVRVRLLDTLIELNRHRRVHQINRFTTSQALL